MHESRQASHADASHRQRVSMADKQVQAGGSLERVPKLRRNSQSGTLQPSPSMRSMRPILGETTLNMLEVGVASRSLPFGTHAPTGVLRQTCQRILVCT